MELLVDILPSAGTIAAVIVGLFIAQRLLQRNRAAVAGRSWRNQLTMLGLTAVGLLLIILVVPIGDARRGQLLSLIGILLSAAIALSSTTVLSNAMAGLMLRAVRSFRIGDFVRTGDHFGRVTERGLFHTEIQTEFRELTTLPNLYLVTHPVTTIRSSGTIVSAEVSLGYDVPHVRIERLLLDAAAQTGLSEPFVHVLELGDFSVSYRVAGLLQEVKQLLTTRSRLRTAVMDALHGAGVEIVSPAFMNQRQLRVDQEIIPVQEHRPASGPSSSAPEELVFDKADEAESVEALRATRDRIVEELKAAKEAADKAPKGPERDVALARVEKVQARIDRMEAIIAAREERASGSE